VGESGVNAAAAVSEDEEQTQASRSARSEWARRHPPLVAFVVALALAVIVMPSSLNLPQADPATTLEFAPIPPEDDTPPPPMAGNLQSLSLAGSDGLEQGGAPGGSDGGGGGGVGPGFGGIGANPSTKRCVGNPPRQTEDRLAPPCVAFFNGDNGGATYQGVTRDEIRILFYLEGVTNINACTEPNKRTPDGQYFDLALPPEPGEHCALTALRVWQTYFNDRYQTYNRFAHFFVYFSPRDTETPAARRADAADNFARIKPFAVVTTETTQVDEYFRAMAGRGVLAFDASFGRDARFFNAFPGLIWGFLPTIQLQAAMFGGLLCRKVVGQPVVSSGNPGEDGGPRKLGLVYTTDESRPDLRAFKDMIIADVERRCGFDLGSVPTHTFPSAGYNVDTANPPGYATTAMADFQAQGVTTIIWPGGLETNFSKAAGTRGYYPEVVIAGDRIMEGRSAARDQDQSFWHNAFVMTNLTAELSRQERPCEVAYRETDPDAYGPTLTFQGCPIYPSIRQLFTGIQVAGPRLTPATMDRGFHAIPHVASTDPAVPACFYEVNDYTCVKDAMFNKWDRTAEQSQGCYRLIQNGLRHPADSWPAGNVDAQYSPDAPCNTYSTAQRFRGTAPT